MTLHMWFGLSVKCLDIRSPPDASTRRSQLRHTKVNLRGNGTSIMLHALKKSVHSLKNVLTSRKMDFCYDPFSEIFFWYYGIWQRQKKDLSQEMYKTLEQTSATDTTSHHFLLTLSYDSRWKLCNLSGTCMHHRLKPTGNGKGSGRL